MFMYQRRKEKLQETCAELGIYVAESANQGGFDILINCTGVGMHESVGLSPVEDRSFNGATVAIDLIYEPQESEFLRQAKSLGLQTINGGAMLFYQAYYADCLYLDEQPSSEQAVSLYKKYKSGK